MKKVLLPLLATLVKSQLTFDSALSLSVSESLQRTKDTCGDDSGLPCYQCLENLKSKYCRYTKAFSRYLCCHEGDTDGMCNSKDPDVECSDRYTGLLKYQVCYRETLKCGSDQVFIVDESMPTMTTDFFQSPGICIYKVKTYEANDNVR